MKRNDKYCKGCIYHKKIHEFLSTCDYLLDTGKRRPCDPGKGCTVKTTKRPKERKAVKLDGK